jgi:hypothetical protein
MTTKPRITAAMLRKRPKTADDPKTGDQQGEPAAVDADATLPMQAGSIADHPSFRAPQFGIRPKKETVQPSIHVQRSSRRGLDRA